MNAFRALLYDSWQEAYSSRLLWIVAGLTALICAALMFFEIDYGDASRTADHVFEDWSPGGKFDLQYARFEGKDFALAFRWSMTHKEATTVIAHEYALRHSMEENVRYRTSSKVNDETGEAVITDLHTSRVYARIPKAGIPDAALKSFEFILRSRGFDRVELSLEGNDPIVITGSAKGPAAFCAKLVMLKVPFMSTSVEFEQTRFRTIYSAQAILDSILLGGGSASTCCIPGVGLLVVLIMSAASIPHMLARGTVEFWLCKPASRAKILLAKYVAGMVYIGLIASIVLIPTEIVFGIKAQMWNPYRLLIIPGLIISFAAFYPVALFIGVISKSTMMTQIFCVAIYIVSIFVSNFHAVLKSDIDMGFPDTLKTVWHIIYYVIPKPGDIQTVFSQLSMKFFLSPEMYAASPESKLVVEYDVAFGTAAVFCGIVMLLTWLIFRRKNY